MRVWEDTTIKSFNDSTCYRGKVKVQQMEKVVHNSDLYVGGKELLLLQRRDLVFYSYRRMVHMVGVL